MEYITHHRFRGMAACAERLNIPYGTKLGTENDFITMPDGRPICRPASENAHLYFAINIDGRGLERGALTYAVAYSQRERRSADGRRQRFTDGEIVVLAQRWPHFLRQDTDTVLFNQAFFDAPVEDLQELADTLGIKVRR